MKAKHKLREAIELLYSRGCASSEVYTNLVLNCVRHNDIEQAKRLQSHMDLHLHLPANTFLHNRLLHLYAKSGLLSDAEKLFDKMPTRDILSYNAMLSAYSKSGLVEDLWEFFNRMPRCDTVSYNTVIAGLAACECSSKALEVFVRMQKEGFEATEYTHVSALNVCSRLLDLKRGKQIHGRIIASGLEGNVYVWNALSDMYAKCGEIHQARWLFDRNIDKNVVSWNSIISAYLKNGLPDRAIGLFREMQLAGLKPDVVTVSNVLGAFFQSGYVNEAQRTFNELKEKDTICWTTMIVGYAQSGKEEDALTLFYKMLLENIKPDSFTISSVVSSCAGLALLCHGQAIHGRAVHMGVDGELLVSSTIVDMYCKCGETKDAWTVFSLMPTQNVVSWNSIIIGYAQNGKDLDALTLYDKMLQENFKPDIVTFVGVLSACLHAGLVERGEDSFKSMRELHGITPTLDHYACMINLFGRSGYMDRAIDLVKSMPHEPNCLIWSTLLSICAMKGDIEHGEMAARQLFGLDPHNAGPYIMLSNMYAACGRWKDVASMRTLMKNKNVKKFAAYSWIEIDGEVYKFVAEDRNHPESETIYKELNRLVKKMQDAGFIPQTNLVLHDVREDEKLKSICYHSEKLALAFGLIKKPHGGAAIRIIKNIRVCPDCHEFMKFVSKINGRPIILRDSSRFHHFDEGQCSCNGLWFVEDIGDFLSLKSYLVIRTKEDKSVAGQQQLTPLSRSSTHQLNLKFKILSLLHLSLAKALHLPPPLQSLLFFLHPAAYPLTPLPLQRRRNQVVAGIRRQGLLLHQLSGLLLHLLSEAAAHRRQRTASQIPPTALIPSPISPSSLSRSIPSEGSGGGQRRQQRGSGGSTRKIKPLLTTKFDIFMDNITNFDHQVDGHLQPTI